MTNSQDLASPLASEAKPASHVNAWMAEVHCQFLLSELVDGDNLSIVPKCWKNVAIVFLFLISLHMNLILKYIKQFESNSLGYFNNPKPCSCSQNQCCRIV